jgi:hypothetical protein
MMPLRWALAAVCLPLWAQNVPHLGYVLPAGGQQGTTVRVMLGGQFLPNVSAVYVSGAGVQARLGEFTRPMNGNQATELRERMEALQKLPPAPATQKEMVEIRGKLLKFNFGRGTSPGLAETLAVDLTIAANAAPGNYELRVASPQGLSNPLWFAVGSLSEVAEKEVIDVVMPPGDRGGVNLVRLSQPPTDMAVTLPVVVNGRIKPRVGSAQQQARPGQPFTPGEADRYRFQALRGQQLVAAVSARELMPYLADAVPGWFQAVLTLYDSKGREVAYDDDFRFHPDPVIHYSIPEDGEYTVEIRDAIYRGREDFVYRIAIGEVPFVTGLFPLGGRAGTRARVALTGWNLPAKETTLDLAGRPPGAIPVTFGNTLPFQVDTLPEVLEKELNDVPARAQRLKLPAIVNGRIDRPGDVDVFRFEGRAGQQVVAEVRAHRLDSPVDSRLRLTDAAGKQIEMIDDAEDPGAGLETHHADSRMSVKLPVTGAYYFYLSDTQHAGGADHAYRLRISEPRPDFELRVAPSGISLGSGITAPVTVYALRRDGFSGAIGVSLKDAPPGFKLSGARIPEGQDQVRMTLTAPPALPDVPLALKFEGHATAGGREVTREAAGVENMMQAFFYHHLVPAGDPQVMVRRGTSFRVPIQVAAGDPLRIPAGGTVRVRVRLPLPPNGPIEKVHYELSEPPPGVELEPTPEEPGGGELVLRCDAAKAKVGLQGNLIVTLSGQRKPQPNAAAQAAAQRIPLGVLPAIPFEIVR